MSEIKAPTKTIFTKSWAELTTFDLYVKAPIYAVLCVAITITILAALTPLTPEEQAKANAERAAKAQAAAIKRAEEDRQERLEQPHTFCSFAWKEKFGNSLHDPDSLDFDFSNKQLYVFNDPKKEKIGIVEVPYRARNGFGGLVRKTAECWYSKETGHIIKVVR
ncbi:MAG: hypothetical protein RLZZ481_2106 [Pseudomonadota bacterium]|jgi:hypothetical protein